MNLAQAWKIGDRVKAELAIYCHEIEIAGSVRRCKPEVKDIEIVCRPKVVESADLFGGVVAQGSLLLEYLNSERWRHVLLKGKEKYRQYALTDGIHLDLFMVMPPAQFGLQYVIRTGPAAFSHWLVSARKYGGASPSNVKYAEGAVWQNGVIVPMPTEESVFRFLCLESVEPSKRMAPVGGRW